MADNDLSPFTKSYSEIHENRILVRIRPGRGGDGNTPSAASVSYWDSMTGGQFKRTVSKRARPGMKLKAKVPGLGIDIGEITLKRAFNERAEDRQPLEPMLGLWLSGTDAIEGFVLTVEKVLLRDDGTLDLLESFTGPVVSYEPPNGNTESENFASETLVIDPGEYIGPESMQPKS